MTDFIAPTLNIQDSIEVDPLEVLKDDLAEDEVIEVQLEAIRNLDIVAIALGPQRTCSDLFPFLDQHCFPSAVQAHQSADVYSDPQCLAAKEEVMKEIAAQITPKFIKYCGGSQPAFDAILPLLEKLAMVEETVIRQASVLSIQNLIIVFKLNDRNRVRLLAMINRLADDKWFTSRISCCSLLPVTYKLLILEENKSQILKLMDKLCNDAFSTMVKKHAFSNLVDLIMSIQSQTLIINWIKPLLTQLSMELMEEIRLSMVEIVLTFVKKMSMTRTKKSYSQSKKIEQETMCAVFLKLIADDSSWRVRKHFAEKFAVICSYIEKHRRLDDCLPIYIQLLQDPQSHVIKEAMGILTELIQHFNAAKFILPLVLNRSSSVNNLNTNVSPTSSNSALNKKPTIIEKLANNDNDDIRAVLADQVTTIGKQIKNIKQVKTRTEAYDNLVIVMKKMVGDSHFQARLNLCSRLSDVSEFLGSSVFDKEFLPQLHEMTIDQKWRVRNSIVQNIAAVGKQLGGDQFIKIWISSFLIQSMTDPAYYVRQTAAVQVRLLFDTFGYMWMKTHFFKDMKRIYDESRNYLHRMCPLKALHLMCIKHIRTNEHVNRYTYPPIGAVESEGQGQGQGVTKKKSKEMCNGDGGSGSGTGTAGEFAGQTNAPYLVLTSDQIKNDFQTMLVNGLKDPICNVRFTTCKILIDVLARLDQPSVAMYRTILNKLAQGDPDKDVRYFAGQALIV